MGRQVVFYATPTDAEAIFRKALDRNVIILDESGEELSFQRVMDMIRACFAGEKYACNLFLTLDGMQIEMTDNKRGRYVDMIKSEVIVFNPCTQQMKYILDMSSVEEAFKKGDFVVVDDVAKFNKLLAELEKHPTYKKNPAYFEFGFNHARFWLASSFFGDCGEKVMKNEKICKLYSYLQRYIRTNFKLSLDRFWYIGNDAYKQYHLGTFVPSSGKTIIKF